MITYEYHCNKCGNFERKENMLDNRLTICPVCGDEVRQVFHPVEIMWRGNSFWERLKGGGTKIPPALGE